ncbi:dimethylaniline monooxygenase [N-oxide-forming] 2-like isoform X2 [Hyperolius riggenbachi]
MAMKVAIIGAGCSGLAAIKICVEDGMDPTCFERSDDIGGIWRYTETVEEGRGSIYQSIFTNTSKEMMCYSDFPMPEDFPVYLNHSKMLEYLYLYAEHFKLKKYIQFQTEVCGVRQHSDFATTGQWDIEIEIRGKRSVLLFDVVIVCSGHFNDPYMPLHSFPGIEHFKGHYIHSRFFKTSDNYRGKTVLVVGNGNSAGDISVEISHVAKQVFLSTRNGSWVVSRISRDGFPIDIVVSQRSTMWIRNVLPKMLAARMMEKLMSRWFDHSNFGLEPKNRLKHPMVNDYLPSHILQGSIKVKPGIASFSGTSVTFEDGTVAEVDEVIFATGYNSKFPFLDDSLIKLNDNDVFLYKYVFPVHLEKPTIAFLGLIQPLGPTMPTVELQARWVSKVFKGVIGLPTAKKMENHIVKSKVKKYKWYGMGRTQAFQTDYIDYITDISKEIGVHPSILSLAVTDPKLAWQVFFGPCTPYQLRIMGHGKWSGARNAIFTQWERIIRPTKTRILHEESRPFTRMNRILTVCLVITILWFGTNAISKKKHSEHFIWSTLWSRDFFRGKLTLV